MSIDRRVVALVVFALAGCLKPQSQACHDGRVCPSDNVCDEAHSRCLFPDQLTSCNGLAEGATCNVNGKPVGGCKDGVCLIPGCGDEVVSGPEQCDTTVPENKNDCTDHGFYAGGAVTCSDNCTFETGNCTGYCGDGVLDSQEKCDPADATLGGKDCTNFGYYNAAGLKCSDACTFDTSECDAHCGDGVKNGPEQCDGPQLGGNTCTSLGYYGGTLGCTAGCAFETKLCSGRCGDNVRNGSEACDGSDTPNQDCSDFGFYSAGSVGCTAACSIDTSGCAGYCGDRTVTPNLESCDGKAPAQSCVDLGADFGESRCSNACTPDLSDCQSPFSAAWQTSPPSPLAKDTGLWGTSPTNIYAVGCSGSPCSATVAHFDGTSWTMQAFAGVQPFEAIWGSSATDVFAVGDDGSIYHFNGSWSLQTTSAGAFFRAVWGSSSNDVYAVGNGTVLHYTGSWGTPAGLPAAASTTNLTGVWGSSAQDVFVVGGGGFIMHFNGSTWSQMTVPASATLSFFGVVGTAPNDVYAYGQNGMLLHYDGTNWITVNTNTQLSFHAAWASTSGNVYVAGSNGYIAHYDGLSLSILDTSADTATHFFGVWGSDAEHVFAISLDGQFRRFGAKGWGITIVPTQYQLLAVYSPAPKQFVAVGTNGVVVDGLGKISTPVDTTPLNGVTGNTSEVIAVGYSGKIIRRTTGAWASMTSTVSGTLNAVSSSGPGTAFAVGNNGVVLQMSGTTWTQMTTPSSTPLLTGVWESSSTSAFAVGHGATFWRLSGSTWTSQSPPPASTTAYNAVWGTSPSDVFAVGGAGTIVHFNGSTWSPMTSGTTKDLHGVSGRGPADVYAVGDGGTILHYDGLAWSPTRTKSSDEVVAAARTFAITLSSPVVYEWADGCATSESACSDGADDDCDGLYDCADPDCSGNATCIAGGACTGAVVLACNATQSDSTLSGSRVLSQYACDQSFEYGRERIYKLTPTNSGTVSLSLSSQSDLDLVVLASTAGACNPRGTGCLAASSARDVGATDMESASFTATGGTTYYVIVDGFGSAADTFDLDVTCP